MVAKSFRPAKSAPTRLSRESGNPQFQPWSPATSERTAESNDFAIVLGGQPPRLTRLTGPISLRPILIDGTSHFRTLPSLNWAGKLARPGRSRRLQRGLWKMRTICVTAAIRNRLNRIGSGRGRSCEAPAPWTAWNLGSAFSPSVSCQTDIEYTACRPAAK